MHLQFDKVFDSSCLTELENRHKGKSKLGPAKVYAMALCEQESVAILQNGSFKISREGVSILVVLIDIVIMIIFMLAIFRLKWYEKLTVQDVKRSTLRIEDFSVHLDTIPATSDKYFDDPDLLSAMLVPQIEDEVAHELEKGGET